MCPGCIKRHVEEHTADLRANCVKLEKLRRGSWVYDGDRLTAISNRNDSWIDEAQAGAVEELRILVPILIDSVKNESCPHVSVRG